MKSPSRVSSKSKLADSLGISRPTLYAFMRLGDSPPARNGYWNVAEWRQFVTRKKDSVKTCEKEQLQLALLRAKLGREQYVFGEAKETTRNQILDDVTAQFQSVLFLHV